MPGVDVARRPWQADRAGEDRRVCSADTSKGQANDPIAVLIAGLDAAATACRPMAVDGHAPVQVRRVAGGYAVERGP